MATTTVGKAILKHFLPKDLHEYVENTVLDKKGISNLFSTLAELHPEKYGDVVSHLTRAGFEIATRDGASVSLQDLVNPVNTDEEYDKLDKQVAGLDKGKLGQVKYNEKLFGLYNDFSDQLTKKILQEGVKKNHTLAKIVVAGSRGSPAQYRSTVATQGIVMDAHQQPMLDFPVRRSFAEGLTLPEYLSHSYGSRYGEVQKKLATAEAGYTAKQLSRAGMTIKVEEHDCGTENGLPVPVEDRDSIGCFLAHPVGSFNRNNEVTSSMLNTLAHKKIANIVVRSPITCASSKKYHFGAVCQMCCGKREKGLPAIGTYIGVIAGASISEPLTQGVLNTRHGGAGASKNPLSGGYKLIDQLFNIPKAFKNKAALASQDGAVTSIKPSAAGGSFIHINDVEHYVPVDFSPTVKVGDKVEAGDVLSEGLINPAEVVQYKGIGAGRKYFTDTMKKVFDQAGMNVNRRNFEVIARAAIDHVQVKDPEGLGDYLPDQIVSYHAIEKNYKPRAGASVTRVDHAHNKYLEAPVLHHTIGSRVTNSMVDELKKAGVQSVTVHDKPTGFEPIMTRLLSVPTHVSDWIHQLYSTNLEKSLVDSVNKGISNTSSLKGPSPIAGISYGLNFDQNSRAVTGQ